MKTKALNESVMSRKGIFWTIGEYEYLVYYPIISYQIQKVYSAETMYMVRLCLKNGLNGK